MTNNFERDGTFICHECIDDAFLKAEVQRDEFTHGCSFCGKPGRAWPLDALADRVQSVIEEHFEISPNEPSEEDFRREMDWEPRGTPIGEIIAEIVGLKLNAVEAVRKRLSETAGRGEFAAKGPFGLDTHYEERTPNTLTFHKSWDFFRQEIMTRARFFGREAQHALDEIFGDLASLETWQGKPAIKVITPTDEDRFLYRARIAYSEAELREFLQAPVEQLGPPPSRHARAGRMNAAGIAVFYGARDENTCIAEVRPPVGSYVVLGRFEIIRPVRVLDFDVLTSVVTRNSWFDPEFSLRSSRAAFLGHLVDEISRPIMPRDEESDYLPTQAVSEYLASCVEPRLDGIIFHSAQTAREGRNIVFFHHASEVKSYALPAGTKVEFDMGWTSLDLSDESITIWETLPPSKTLSIKGTTVLNKPPDIGDSESGATRETTLRLDVGNIALFRIEAVSYHKAKRSVSRHRRRR